MGMAKLNIWVSGMDEPCAVSDRTWYVTIYNCDGEVLEWCGKKYVVLPAKCGHLEEEVPPGVYYIKAVWSYREIEEGKVYRCNHFTDAAIVEACCDKVTCVKLFNPSIHRCGNIVIKALTDLVKQKGIKDQEAVKRAVGELNAVLEQIPRPPKLFELGHDDEIERLVKKQAR